MLKQLFKQIWVQRKTNAWLWAEMVIVFMCLSYIVDYLYVTGKTYFSPLGYNIEHVYLLKLGEVPANSNDYIPDLTGEEREEHFSNILDRLRTYPGVESVAVNRGAYPYSTSNSTGMRGIDTVWVHGNIFHVGPRFFEVFRIKDKNGEIAPLVEAAMQERTMVINTEAEKEFLEKGVDPLNSGMKNYNGTEPYVTVRGISVNTRFNEFNNLYPAYYECGTDVGLWRGNGVYVDLCVRVSDKEDDAEFEKSFRNAMKNQLRIGNIYLLEMTSFDDVRTNYYRSNGQINEVKTYIAGLFFLLLNIFLGVIGTFWVRTQQRRSEIGLRLALGSSHTDIRKLLLGEGLLIFLVAAIPASVVVANLVWSGILTDNPDKTFEVWRFIISQLLTFIIIVLMIVTGILFPASQAMKIKPAVALHEE